MRHKRLNQKVKLEGVEPPPGPADSRVILRYTLLQLPALLTMSLIGGLLVHWQVAKWPLVLAGLALWAVKDAALYPFVWRSYTGSQSPNSDLYGSVGYVTRVERHATWARFGRSLWRVEHHASQALPVGRKVKVVGDRDLILVVESVEDQA